jgi:hypothetical protein
MAPILQAEGCRSGLKISFMRNQQHDFAGKFLGRHFDPHFFP